ncbi:hypothetical protein ACLB2K_039402 [Fragaria x ananassa]
MVYTGASEERTRVTAAAMNSERAAKPLHNFSLPWDLKWGNQRHLRCMKVEDSDADAPPAGFDRRSAVGMTRRRGGESEGIFERRSRARRPRIDDGVEAEEEGIEAVREKLMFEFKTAADKMKDAILRGEEDIDLDVDDEVVAPAPFAPAAAVVTDVAAPAEEEDAEAAAVEEGGSSPAAAATTRPWNLRTRRAACKAPIGGGGGSKGLRIEERKVNYSPLMSEGNNGGKSPRLVRGASGSGLEKKERPKFSLTLSKKEIDEDFMQILGHRAPRRPKKRPRAVQKQLDALFPGMWLTEVSADSYKVPEFPENVKR